MVKSTGRKISQISFSGDDLHKRVGFVPFLNQSAFSDPLLAKTFQQRLSEQFAEICSNQRQAGESGTLATLPMLENGLADNLALAAEGRLLGLNAVVTGAVISVGALERSEGWFWFKGPQAYAQVRVATDVYDTLTGAKLLYESISTEIEIDEDQYEAIKAGKVNNEPAVETAMMELAERSAEQICESLSQIPWVGYVIAAKGSNVTLAAGADAGLESGQIFDVFHSQQVYTGNSGQAFFVPDLAAGQIRITTVSPDRAEAESISGEPPVVGDAVRLVD
ncbi:MAG: hypothetical protein JEZ11_25815 [Desulfobacterales bacterium]|nr:hypothetical protein [Desulfobacterales bacterium]